MKRHLFIVAMFVASLCGCVSSDTPPETGGVRAHYGRSFGPPTVPGVEGPYGTKVPMAAPYNMAPPRSQQAALEMMGRNLPTSMVQMHRPGGPMGGPPGSGMPNPMMPGNMISPPGVPALPGMPGGMPGMPGGMPGAMPGGMPGGMPGMPGGMPGAMPGGMPGGMPPMPGMPPTGNPLMKTDLKSMMPDAGVMNANIPPGVRQPGGVLPTQFASSSQVGSMFPAQRTQVYFGNPVRMKVYWFTQGADGKPNYSTTPLETPGRYNFAQGAIYRLKLTNIPGRPALELYPTLEVVPTSPKTNEFLAHNSVPLDFSEEDFKQVVDRNYIVKVIYLPDPQFQDAAGAGPGEITSAQLEPGQDPIQEALRRGSILLVLRIGNIDQGLISSPPTTAPIPSGPPMMMKPPGMGVPPGVQVPFNLPPITPGAPVVIPPGGPGVNPGVTPPVGPGGVPPLFNVPELPAPKNANPGTPDKIDAKNPPLLPPPPAAKPEDGANPPVGVPPLSVPPVSGPAVGVPPLPLPPPALAPKNPAPVVPPPVVAPNSAAPVAPLLPVPPPALAPKESAPGIPPLPVPPKGVGSAPEAPMLPPPPVIPAASTKEVDRPGFLPAPAVPPVTPAGANRPALPTIPATPEWPGRK